MARGRGTDVVRRPREREDRNAVCCLLHQVRVPLAWSLLAKVDPEAVRGDALLHEERRRSQALREAPWQRREPELERRCSLGRASVDREEGEPLEALAVVNCRNRQNQIDRIRRSEAHHGLGEGVTPASAA